ncbi:hypothetical protein TNCV_4600651 [Trichonephila clavipes]|nr:hypothetical protein TNCV_4600651 [Trichonephila clavipes]
MPPDSCSNSGKIMVWEAFSWHVLGSKAPLEISVNSSVYFQIIIEHVTPAYSHFVGLFIRLRNSTGVTDLI